MFDRISNEILEQLFEPRLISNYGLFSIECQRGLSCVNSFPALRKDGCKFGRTFPFAGQREEVTPDA